MEKLEEYGKMYLEEKIERDFEDIERFISRIKSPYLNKDVNEKIYNMCITEHIDNYLRTISDMKDCNLDISKQEEKLEKLIDCKKYKEFKKEFADEVNRIKKYESFIEIIKGENK